ncbi:hypothetical protein L195_g033132 [Trifolium pratense]|uniref:RNase H type-1 domain-containing protein n=1 Tax=Trifolium pratense TaxID=57577 RepID=A0A2K3LF41_TRIPR|nr:hypothetical protein L195_g033132 [Trifolium pratense]
MLCFGIWDLLPILCTGVIWDLDPSKFFLSNLKEEKKKDLAWKKIWKLNVPERIRYDGVVRIGNQQTRCRGVIRDERGQWVCGLAKALGPSNASAAELWGVLNGGYTMSNELEGMQ